MDPDFVERRRIGLENFLLRVASHPVLCRDKIFYLFLTQEGNWKETVNETGFQLKVRTVVWADSSHPFTVPSTAACTHWS
ncbi:rCG53037 [Rattus norvegicus]|uniref:RCG53037 n=1 Tax=Rattus norvegicus TaxID=10116 RepID=A6IRL6_RAT|nr:rCG53037 [Rattus norvegicus]